MLSAVRGGINMTSANVTSAANVSDTGDRRNHNAVVGSMPRIEAFIAGI